MLQTLRPVLLAAILASHGVAPAWAQPSGSVGGVVRDGTGAVLPRVAVSVTNAALGSRGVSTDREGRFIVDAVPPGHYVVEASVGGFRSEFREVDVEDGPVLVDFVLAVPALLDRVTVTAAKTGTADIQATPIAMTALPARTLEQLDVHTVEGLAGFVPSMTVSHFGGLAQVNLRGIGTNVLISGGDPSTTVHLDGVYLGRPSMLFLDFLNVERVEVLRGPQGTLYGRNSVGGTIDIVTRRPTNTLEASARLTAGSDDRLGAEATVSGPLIKDKVMANVAFARAARDGFVHDLEHPGNSLGSEDTWAVRGQVRVVFARRHELLVTADYGRFDAVPLPPTAKPILAKPGFSFDSPASLWTVRASDAAHRTNTQKGASARLALELNGTTTLNSITAYRTADDRFFIDADGTELKVQAGYVPDYQHQVSQELTLVQRRRRLTWIAGAYLFDEHDEAPVRITVYPATQLRPFASFDTSARAVFGQATYDLWTRVSFTAGARYTAERKDIRNHGGAYLIGTDILVDPRSYYAVEDSSTFDAWTPKAGVQARVASDTLVYVSATKGFKSGGFNPAVAEQGRPYNRESAWSYETGIKCSTANGRARLNVAIFHTDYQDLQVQSFIRPGVPDISNAASARITGLEVEAAAMVRGGLQLAGHVSWLDATYERYLATGPGGARADVSGHRLNNAPVWSGSGSAIYAFGMVSGALATLRTDLSWQSRVFFTPFNTAVETQGPYALVRMRAGVEPRSGRWELAAYVHNIGNQRYLTATEGVSLAAFTGRPGEPRQWGTQFTVRR